MSNFCYKVVLVRHGQSTWNKSNQFTGWTTVQLTPQGKVIKKSQYCKRCGRSDGSWLDPQKTQL